MVQALQTEYDETVLEHKISSLIAEQFPRYFQENGLILVAFVQEYYKWLEGSQLIANNAFVGKGYVQVNSKNPIVQGYGTDFPTFFANGDSIALFKQDTLENYDLMTIDTVVNSSYLTVTSDTLPEFSSVNSWYTTTFTQFNPNALVEADFYSWKAQAQGRWLTCWWVTWRMLPLAGESCRPRSSSSSTCSRTRRAPACTSGTRSGTSPRTSSAVTSA